MPSAECGYPPLAGDAGLAIAEQFDQFVEGEGLQCAAERLEQALEVGLGDLDLAFGHGLLFRYAAHYPVLWGNRGAFPIVTTQTDRLRRPVHRIVYYG